MSSTNKTTNYNLSQFVGTDIPSILNDYNGDMQKIDTAVHNVSVAGGDNASAIASLQSTVSGHTSQITQIDSNVTAVSGRVLTVEGKVTTVEGKVANIEDVIPSGASASDKLALASDVDDLDTNLSASIQNAQATADDADFKANSNAESIQNIIKKRASKLTVTGSTFAEKFSSAIVELKEMIPFTSYTSLQKALVNFTIIVNNIVYRVGECPNGGNSYDFYGFDTTGSGFIHHVISCTIQNVATDTPSVSSVSRYSTTVSTNGVTRENTSSTLDNESVQAFNNATVY